MHHHDIGNLSCLTKAQTNTRGRSGRSAAQATFGGTELGPRPRSHSLKLRKRSANRVEGIRETETNARTRH